MENLPNEILEIVVFNSLSEKKDTQKCYNINAKWRRNIENIFVGKVTTIFNLLRKGLFFSNAYNTEEGFLNKTY